MKRPYLLQQYPFEGNKWRIIIPISVFIGLFMIVFQPFGLSSLDISHKHLLLAGYGLVTLVILVFNLVVLPAIFPQTFSDEHWMIWKELLFLPWILLTVGLGNLLYSNWTLGFRISLTNMMIFQAYTLSIGLIPITTLILIKQNYLKRKNEEKAEAISEAIILHKAEKNSGGQVEFFSDNEKENLTVQVDDLLFIKSDGNYITVGYLKGKKPARILLRNTMKYAANLLAPFPFIFQCHRSWLVNLHKISHVTGNSQGLRLMLDGFEEDIPVARTNTAAFRQLMVDTEV
ncbi:MAG: LytTR family transcriptional regulator [Bacteroidales bacterium]|jgi:hypothetical protein|nr:LytTR family transcriptional regulator [Bacteroidales bacterium]